MKPAGFDPGLKTIGAIGLIALFVNFLLALTLRVPLSTPMLVYRILFLLFFAACISGNGKASDAVNGSRILRILARIR